MAEKETKQKKKLSKGWKRFLTIMGIIAATAVAVFVPALMGFLTIARDLLLTIPLLGLGGVSAVAIADKVHARRQSKKEADKDNGLERQQSLEQLPKIGRTAERSGNITTQSSTAQDNSKKNISKR